MGWKSKVYAEYGPAQEFAMKLRATERAKNVKITPTRNSKTGERRWQLAWYEADDQPTGLSGFGQLTCDCNGRKISKPPHLLGVPCSTWCKQVLGSTGFRGADPCKKYTGSDRARCEDFYGGLKREMRPYRTTQIAESLLISVSVLAGLAVATAVGYSVWKRK